ncbi:MAG: GNAT family N-acetyltransferase, partial [Eudoraea sp.]|nr:GNAT family N-acetyltransferase [Eudoraea sp.]
MYIKLMQQSDMTPEVVQRLKELIIQLNPSISAEKLSDLRIKGSGSDLFCAFDGNELMGTATLIRYSVLSGNKAWIEDVVVDQKYRRKGVAKALTNALI